MDTPAASLPALPSAAPATLEIAQLAARYRRAQGGVISLVTGLGTRIEKQMEGLPDGVRARIDDATRAALERAYGVANATPALAGASARGHVALAGIAGAVGGFGGLPTALAELPVTVTLILKGIQEVARRHGFDPADPAIRRETLRVFGAGSPLAADDGVNTAFLGARLTLTGPAMHRMVAAVAPKLAASLGQKLAAQTIPVLGAVAGATLNAAYMRYYREMAEVRFGLLALARDHDPAEVLATFKAASEVRPIRRI